LAIESSESAGIAAASTPSSGWLPAVRSTRIEGRHVDHLLAFLTSRLCGSAARRGVGEERAAQRIDAGNEAVAKNSIRASGSIFSWTTNYCETAQSSR
jgi:hypothetical protein